MSAENTSRPHFLTEERVPGPMGVDPPASAFDAEFTPPGAGFMAHAEPEEEAVSRRMITRVVMDWHPPRPRTTPPIFVGGKTLAEASAELGRDKDWCEAGGLITYELVAGQGGDQVTLNLHANLVMRLPSWRFYPGASDAAQAEWDRMLAMLRAHAERHVEIVAELADDLADELFGRSVEDIDRLVDEANEEAEALCASLNRETAFGSRRGVRYGDVFLEPLR